MDSTLGERRRKLTFRAWRRGFREMDLLMGTFADQVLADYTTVELDEFERLLATPDWEVFAWLIGQKDVPDNYKGPVLDQLIAFRYEAQPG
ncbi:MAG: succinate dehydrogenase assembly factor 2 [Pseudomonadota bacterium]